MIKYNQLVINKKYYLFEKEDNEILFFKVKIKAVKYIQSLKTYLIAYKLKKIICPRKKAVEWGYHDGDSYEGQFRGKAKFFENFYEALKKSNIKKHDIIEKIFK